MATLDSKYTMKEVCEAIGISRTFLKDYYDGRIKGKKIKLQRSVTKNKKAKLVDFYRKCFILTCHGQIN